MNNYELTNKIIRNISFTKYSIYNNVFLKTSNICNIIKKHKGTLPYHLNVIKSSARGRLKETGHCRILYDFLRFPAIQESFVNTFLRLELKDLTITRESDRVDISLRNDRYFIIIESKVNGAVEQPSQIYRYVHEIARNKYSYDIDNIYVVYINPRNKEQPSEESLCDENKKNNVSIILNNRLKVYSYKYDIINWLNGLTNLKIENQPHISSALDQYKDYLEWYFESSKDYEPMNKEIKEQIFSSLKISNLSSIEQYKELLNEEENVNSLLEQLKRLKLEAAHNAVIEWKQETMSTQISKIIREDEQSFGFLLNCGIWCGIWDGHDNPTYNYMPYWGLYSKEEANNEQLSVAKKIIERLGINRDLNNTKGYIFWESTTRGVEMIQSLYKASCDCNEINI